MATVVPLANERPEDNMSKARQSSDLVTCSLIFSVCHVGLQLFNPVDVLNILVAI